MKKIVSFYIILIGAISVLLFYQGCSKLQNNITGPTTVSSVHPSGWLDTTNANFHGKYIKDHGWSFFTCITCHGADFKGGTTLKSCYKCHTNGPQACNTCHGSRDPGYLHNWPPQSLNHLWDETDRGVGVHNHHLSPDTNERYSREVDCNECHAPVNAFNDTTHIDSTRHNSAKITFGTLAHTIFHNVVPNPAYDANSNSCASVYCHGYFYGGNQNTHPVFNDPNSVTCGSCHGDPATGNPTPLVNGGYESPHNANYWTETQKLCFACHTDIDMNGILTIPSLHIDGIVEHNEPNFNVNNTHKNSLKSYFIKRKNR